MPETLPPRVFQLDAAMDDVLVNAVRWWMSHRPLGFNREQHLANPTVNLKTDPEKTLGRAVGHWLRQATPAVERKKAGRRSKP